MREQCIVFGCTNEKHQGVFVGDICSPCYKIITEGDLEQPSTNFIHILGLQNKMLKEYKMQAVTSYNSDYTTLTLNRLTPTAYNRKRCTQ